MTYTEKLKDPRWQKKRLEVLERAGWKCMSCGSEDKTLHVHHCVYKKGLDPWDYNASLIALCEYCHNQRGEIQNFLLLATRKCTNDQLMAIVEFLDKSYGLGITFPWR